MLHSVKTNLSPHVVNPLPYGAPLLRKLENEPGRAYTKNFMNHIPGKYRFRSFAAIEEECQVVPQRWHWRGHKITYVAAGNGEEIVLLIHGFGASWGHFRALIPALSKSKTVYGIDLLGFGSSEKPNIEYCMEIWSEQIQDFIKDVISKEDGSNQVTLIGNSIGSLASLMVAADNPDNVKSLVLLNCAGGMNNKAVTNDWRIKIAMPLFKIIDVLLMQPSIARYLFDAVRRKENLERILKGIYPGNPDRVDKELIHLLHAPSCEDGALDVFVSCLVGPPGPSPQSLLKNIECPLALVWGDKDALTPLDGPVGKYFQSLPHHRPNTTFILLEGAGHCLFDEMPDKVLNILDNISFTDTIGHKDKNGQHTD